MLTYGQTWHSVNMYPVVPGYASIYRTRVLRHLKIEIPGLAIEDFNMAFQIHKKKLGVITFNPSIVAISQDPDNFEDYCKQLMRWNVGFFQTIKHWKVWPSMFWIPLSMFILENMIIAFIGFSLPVILVSFLLFSIDPAMGNVLMGYEFIALMMAGVIILLIADYLLTLLVALTSRNDMLSVYGIGFFFLYYVNSVIFLIAIPRAFFKT
jgi:poly-beta-1,6-N-acetyl-D-glucosamine synthase